MESVMQLETALKEKSNQFGIPFSNLLRGSVIEEIMKLIYESEYAESFWLSNPWILGANAYSSNRDQSLTFYYLESEEAIPVNQLIPGQRLSWKMASYMIAMIFRKDRSKEIDWKGRAVETKDGYQWNLIGEIGDMQVPVVVRLIPFIAKEQAPEKMQLQMIRNNEITVKYLGFSTEHLLSQHFFQIMNKLELISSLESYAIVDKLLRSQTISGRYMMEEMNFILEKNAKVLKYKRIKQIASYRDYTYMKKRWEKYEKSQEYPHTEWSEIIDRFLKFAEPLWKAMCDNNIFFEDWMPEIERFLA